MSPWKRTLQKSKRKRNTENGLISLNQNDRVTKSADTKLEKREVHKAITPGNSFPIEFTWILETTVQACG